jgi:DNA-binding IclR family transcriptional regulator
MKGIVSEITNAQGLPERRHAANALESGTAVRQAAPRSATRITNILSLLANRRDGVTLAQLSQLSGTPKSSLLALLRALTANRFLQWNGERYAIGPEAFRLASMIMAQRSFPDIAVPIVEALAERTGESAFLAELDIDAGLAVYIYKAESRNALRFIAEVGAREPLYSSAVGRVLLAFQPAEWQERYLRHVKLGSLTPKTIRRKGDLRNVLEAVRRHHLATSFEETLDGVAGIAGPILNKTGDVLAGLVIGVPALRAISRIEVLERQVTEAAAKISRLMGYTGAWPKPVPRTTDRPWSR